MTMNIEKTTVVGLTRFMEVVELNADPVDIWAPTNGSLINFDLSGITSPRTVTLPDDSIKIPKKPNVTYQIGAVSKSDSGNSVSDVALAPFFQGYEFKKNQINEVIFSFTVSGPFEDVSGILLRFDLTPTSAPSSGTEIVMEYQMGFASVDGDSILTVDEGPTNDTVTMPIAAGELKTYSVVLPASIRLLPYTTVYGRLRRLTGDASDDFNGEIAIGKHFQIITIRE